jgi:uncharacterized protein
LKTIFVVSDIHYGSRLNKIPYEKINKYVKTADYIFALGDYENSEGLNFLYSFGKEVYAVAGNMDTGNPSFSLPDILTLDIEKVSIGLIHGWGGHYGLRDKIRKRFNTPDLICYGHTHESFFKKENGIYFFNPGSLCGEKTSFGILKIDGKSIKAEIIIS